MRVSTSSRSCFNPLLPQGRDGFTLIEVLVAISLLAIVLTAVYGIFGGVNSAKLRLDRDSADYHLARVVFDRLGRELHGVYFRRGDQTTMLRGGINEHNEPFLELTTTAVTLLSATGSGISEVRYRLAQDLEVDKSRQVLLRSERSRQSATVPVDERMMRLAPNVASLSLRFFSNDRWQEQWDARQDGLPQLVEISLEIGPDEQRLIPFTTTFEIPDISVQ